MFRPPVDRVFFCFKQKFIKSYTRSRSSPISSFAAAFWCCRGLMVRQISRLGASSMSGIRREVFSFPISSDSRFWIPGTTAELSISLPLARLAKGSYTVYFQMTDPVLQREILPANTFSHDTHGFSIGTLEISKLY